MVVRELRLATLEDLTIIHRELNITTQDPITLEMGIILQEVIIYNLKIETPLQIVIEVIMCAVHLVHLEAAV